MKKLLKFKDFVALLEASIYQPKDRVALRKPFWDAYYDSVSQSSPKGTKPKEIIRAPFGLDSDGTAEDRIKLMFKKAGVNFDKIEKFQPGEIRDGKNLGSRLYYSYKITSGSDIYWVTNSTVEISDGRTQEVGGKDLTAKKLGLCNKVYHDAQHIIRDIETGLQSIKTIKESTSDFLLCLAKIVASDSTSKYLSMEEFFRIGKVEEIIKFKGNQFHIDDRSLTNIVNDFGEVLDGIYLLSTIKRIDEGLEFPEGETEALSDMWMDGWNVSSKSEKGGAKPSINALVKVCKQSEDKLNELDLQTTEEHELFQMMLSLFELKGSKNILPTVESYTLIASKLLQNGKLSTDSGFGYFIDYFRVNKVTSALHRKTILNYLLELVDENPEEYTKFMTEFWKRCNFKPTSPMTPDQFIKSKKGDEFYYSLAVEVAAALNEHYSKAIVTLINKLLVVKQMYLSINLTNETIKFTSTSSDCITAVKFKPRGSSKTFDAGLGYEMKK